MRIIIILFFSPFLLVSQEFYPGSLADLNAPICYNTSAILTFENLPTAGTEGDYSYQWQKSWNGSPWYNIANATSISYETNNLTTDTDFRVLVTQDNINLPTNSISVYVLPPLDAGFLLSIDSICIGSNTPIEFELEPSGAELSWGGFANFSYAWQQGNIMDLVGPDDPVDWLYVGSDTNTHIPILDEGGYYFRCFITSSHGCGTVVTDPIFITFVNCGNSQINEVAINDEIIKTFNILGQPDRQKAMVINLYKSGRVEKIYIIQ